MSPAPRRGLAFWIATGGGSGLAPKAPGTVGSLVALLPWLALRELPPWAYLGLVLLTFALGVWATQQLIAQLNIEDPGLVVVDEWVGLWITLLAVPLQWYWVLAGFLLFRLFDILKPWPVGWADRQLHGGFGAMVDDALAGLMGLIALQGLIYLLQPEAWMFAAP